MIPTKSLVCAVLAVANAVAQQQASAVPRFEAAYVKQLDAAAVSRLPSFPDEQLAEIMRFSGGPGTRSLERIIYRGVTLKMLLARAFNAEKNQISGPAWLDDRMYEIAATLPPGVSAETFSAMLQALLIERFRLDLRHENKVLQVYTLKVGRDGAKLSAVEKQPEYADDAARKEAQRASAMAMLQQLSMRVKQGEGRNHRMFSLPDATVEKFASTLSSNLDRPVQDLTGLNGHYSFQLEWDNDDGISVFEAVRKLGLEMRGEDRPGGVLIVNQASRVPTEN